MGRGGPAGVTSAVADVMMPWRFELHPVFSHANTNWSQVSVGSSILFGGYSQSSGAQNAEASWEIACAAGTYAFTLIHSRDVNRGIYSVQVDTVEVGTIDGYNGSTAHNTVNTSITGIAIATTAKHTIKLKMATKNASSSSYFAAVQHFAMRRTA